MKCTELDEYVWGDNNDWSYNQLTSYGSLVGPVPVKIFVRDSRIKNRMCPDWTVRDVQASESLVKF